MAPACAGAGYNSCCELHIPCSRDAPHKLHVACAMRSPAAQCFALQATVSKDLQLLYILWTALDGPDKQIGKPLHSLLRACCS